MKTFGKVIGTIILFALVGLCMDSAKTYLEKVKSIWNW